MESAMKNLASLVALALALSGCGGAQKQAADPRTLSESGESGSSDAQNEKADTERDTSSGPTVSEGSSDASSSLNSAMKSQVNERKDSSDAEDTATSADSKDREPPKQQSNKDTKKEPSAAGAEQQDEAGPEKCRESETGLALSVDRKTVSIEEGRLQAKMDGPICGLLMRITRKDGLPPIEKSFRYTTAEREMRWNPVPRDQIEKIEIRVSSKDGGYQSVFLIPWSVSIDHEEVQFDTNKAVIRDSEVASLNDSLEKINDVLAKVEDKGLGTITLFIAGHTDTQGSNEHNMTLSRNRAQAIAAWFLKRGLCIPIAFEGFGETALKKLTADNVDEQANRRVDYILSVEPPTIKKGAAPAWKWLSKGC